MKKEDYLDSDLDKSGSGYYPVFISASAEKIFLPLEKANPAPHTSSLILKHLCCFFFTFKLIITLSKL